MSAHAVLVWLARQLQVQQPQRAGAWLLRLFLLPSASELGQPIDSAQVIDPVAWLADRLELAATAPWWLRLWRLWVRPTMPSGPFKQFGHDLLAAARVILWPLGWLAKLLGILWWLSLWPLRMALRQLERLAARIDTERWARGTDRYLAPALALPGLRWLILTLATVAVLIVFTTPFNWAGQLLIILLCWSCSLVMRRLPGRYPGLALMAISLLAMGRYVWWRLGTTLVFDSYIEAAFGWSLLAAEAYTWLVVGLSFMQTAWPLNRSVQDLQGDPASWPSVDVLIPTYNEPMSVLSPTVMAALAMDWPRDKLHVYILDDGNRAAVKDFAQFINAGYIARKDHPHAKAGNLNHALGLTQGELVAIFDCDHLPVSSFLKSTVGCLQQDPQCVLVQTPHHFFSPDPFERNLGTFRRVPNEGTLFYGLIQDGNDFWDATFFCGSCAVIRRAPLMAIGGIAVETVTEDAHTALKLQRVGYSTAYISKTLAAGLATESLSAHIGQRIRWARGMAQIFRTDSPLLGTGLHLSQRLCYANAMLHYFFGFPRLVFLTAPMAYLFFGFHIINANALMLALYVIPYILLSNIANSHVQGVHRHSFWAEVYETVLAWYIIWPTLLAIIRPSAGSFNVTAKGGLVKHPYFNWMISTPYTALALLNLLAFGFGMMRLFFWNTYETSTVILNLLWVLYSGMLLGAAIGVASESRQVRRMHRVAAQLPATLYQENGNAWHGECVDFSMSGLGLQMEQPLSLIAKEPVHVGLWRDGVEHAFPAQVVLNKGGVVGLEFAALSSKQNIDLVQCTFARPNAWSDWSDVQDADRPLQGLKEIALVGLQGYKKLGLSIWESFFGMVREWRTRYHNLRPG